MSTLIRGVWPGEGLATETAIVSCRPRVRERDGADPRGRATIAFVDGADLPPYGDRSPARGASPVRAEWNGRAVGLAVLAIVTSVGALAGAWEDLALYSEIVS